MKQGAIAWNDTIDELLLFLGLHKSEAEGNLYYKLEGDKTTLLLLFVDDLLIMGNDDSMIDQIRKELINPTK